MVELSRGDVFPVLPLRDIVVFPHMIVPLFVGREKSVRALEDVMKDDKQILLVAQKNAAQDDPTPEDIYKVGTVSKVLQLLKLPDGTVKVLVEGGQRARITGFTENEVFFQAYGEVIGEKASTDIHGGIVQCEVSQPRIGFGAVGRVLHHEIARLLLNAKEGHPSGAVHHENDRGAQCAHNRYTAQMGLLPA